MKRTCIAIAIVLAGCGKKDEPKGGSGKLERAATPKEFAAWMPADAQKLWEGAWAGRMTPLQTSKKDHTSLAGDPVAFEVKGNEATAWDGYGETKMKFTLKAPCEAEFAEAITEGSMKGGTSYHHMLFVIEKGQLVIGSGAVGMRKGKAAIVCSEGISGGVTILDDKGGCATWSSGFGKWESKATTCTWGKEGDKETLTIERDVLYVDGDVLADQQFRDFTKYFKRAKDYAEAKAEVDAKLKADDPSEQAKAAGGVVGKTDTIVSLIATFGSDKSLKGKPFEITAQYLNENRMSSGGKETYNVILVDSKDSTKFTLPCDLGETKPPEGLTQFDKVVAKGTIGEAFSKPELEGCTVTKAP